MEKFNTSLQESLLKFITPFTMSIIGRINVVFVFKPIVNFVCLCLLQSKKKKKKKKRNTFENIQI